MEEHLQVKEERKGGASVTLEGRLGWVGCLAEQEVRDRRFKVQSTFSSLAHSVVPPLLPPTQLSDRPVGPGFGITATTS